MQNEDFPEPTTRRLPLGPALPWVISTVTLLLIVLLQVVNVESRYCDEAGHCEYIWRHSDFGKSFASKVS